MTTEPVTPRRPPTAAEARALAHPTRLRIVFACRERAKTNRELAAEIGTTPGTIHYHLRPLVAEGFLRAEEPRRGKRGSRERPYRSTGKSWEVAGDPSTSQILRKVGAEELLAAAEADILSLVRLGITLPPSEVAELLEQLDQVVAAWKERNVEVGGAELDGYDKVTLFLGVHRHSGSPSTSD